MGVKLEPQLIVAAIIPLAILGFFVFKQRSKSRLPLPPGPPKLPLLGNLLDCPLKFQWETFQTWGKKYNSDILHLSVAGHSIIVLNSLEAVRDLLERRSAIYSDRPKFTILNDVMGFSWLMPFMPYGPAWKERRRLFLRHFHPSNDYLHKDHELKYSRRLLENLLAHPEGFMDHIRHCVGSTLHSIAYGGETESVGNQFIKIAEEVAECLSDAALISTMVADVMPSLNPILPYIIPSVIFKRTALQWKELASRFRDDPFWNTQKSMVDGMAQPSFVSKALENITSSDDNTRHHTIIKDVASIIFIGGSSTVNSSLHTFVLAMLCFPEVQTKAQEELDRIVGRARFPDFSDQPHLPYLDAVLKEVHRWRPSGPLGIPHFIEKDDEYKGFHIPKCSVVIANAWAMLHDEQVYAKPDVFNPDRFLKNGYPDLSVRDPSTIAFGFGRR
ncbi:Cytochrome P450 monooxygenase 98 [Psilocybe cubensis]|nr:Cytochrome P450 monooxygenase 98 [Psilocybe cubensis]KAH9477593.1 Cytochrome P450 monooxygenase 98 [Psilocybe cubensis]